jgi:hypothetical protein
MRRCGHSPRVRTVASLQPTAAPCEPAPHPADAANARGRKCAMGAARLALLGRRGGRRRAGAQLGEAQLQHVAQVPHAQPDLSAPGACGCEVRLRVAQPCAGHASRVHTREHTIGRVHAQARRWRAAARRGAHARATPIRRAWSWHVGTRQFELAGLPSAFYRQSVHACSDAPVDRAGTVQLSVHCGALSGTAGAPAGSARRGPRPSARWPPARDRAAGPPRPPAPAAAAPRGSRPRAPGTAESAAPGGRGTRGCAAAAPRTAPARAAAPARRAAPPAHPLRNARPRGSSTAHSASACSRACAPRRPPASPRTRPRRCQASAPGAACSRRRPAPWKQPPPHCEQPSQSAACAQEPLVRAGPAAVGSR